MNDMVVFGKLGGLKHAEKICPKPNAAAYQLKSVLTYDVLDTIG